MSAKQPFGQRFSSLATRLLQRPLLLVGGIVLLEIVGGYYYYTRNRPHLSKVISKANRQIFDAKLPQFLRASVFKIFGRWYRVDFQDVVDPLESFSTLGEFFTRKVKPRTLPIDHNHLLVPADSRVLSLSEVTADRCLIVKDINYSLGEFMTGASIQLTTDEITALKRNPNNTLYQVILYLAPGDYHRFHSPSDFEVVNTNKLGEALYSVSQSALQKFGGTVYEKNDRVLLEGRYWNGYLNIGLVGAFNVGNILVHEKSKFEMGEELGMFRLGSTIVMHFEAPPTTKLNI